MPSFVGTTVRLFPRLPEVCKKTAQITLRYLRTIVSTDHICDMHGNGSVCSDSILLHLPSLVLTTSRVAKTYQGDEVTLCEIPRRRSLSALKVCSYHTDLCPRCQDGGSSLLVWFLPVHYGRVTCIHDSLCCNSEPKRDLW